MPVKKRILVYTRTHSGDPDAGGCFGAHDCMGTVRDREFDAVIGVGRIGDEPRTHEIAGNVNCIVIGPHKATAPSKRGPNVRFDHFHDFGTEGPDFKKVAKELAKRMYDHNVRHIIDDFTDAEYAEALALLKLAENKPPSASLNRATAHSDPTTCRTERRNAVDESC